MTVQDLNKVIGANIKTLRLQNEWAQDELAHLAGTFQANVSHWERGLKMPTWRTLVGLAAIFDVRVWELFLCGGDEV